MRLFLYETMSALGPAGTASLCREGWAMLEAVVSDFSRIPGIQTMTLLARDWNRNIGHSCRRIEASQEAGAFRELAAQADFTLVIAPEFDDVLAGRSRWVLEVNGRLLGSWPDAIVLAGDKLALAEHWRARPVPTPETILLPAGQVDWDRPLPDFFPAVCKPRHGAGSQATFLVPDEDELATILAKASAEMPGADFILQQFVAGLSASVVFFVGPKDTLALLPATQEFSSAGRFHYEGGEVPLRHDLAARAITLGSKAIQSIPGLQGYVGVDLILAKPADGSGDYALEINPRWTTSYIGLRHLACGNLAKTLLGIVKGEDQPALEWRAGRARFGVDGSVELLCEP